jgi:hypothetical protein
MSIFKRENSPYYQYEFRIGVRKFRGSTKVTSKAEARKVEARIKI